MDAQHACSRAVSLLLLLHARLFWRELLLHQQRLRALLLHDHTLRRHVSHLLASWHTQHAAPTTAAANTNSTPGTTASTHASTHAHTRHASTHRRKRGVTSSARKGSDTGWRQRTAGKGRGRSSGRLVDEWRPCCCCSCLLPTLWCLRGLVGAGRARLARC